MALTVSISVTQNNGSPSQFLISDTSTGSDPGITSRRVYLYKADNTTLVNSGTTAAYTLWPIASSSITMDVLTRDTALMFVIQWMTGTTVTYALTGYYAFTAYTNTFLYSLSVDQSTNPTIISATDYFANKTKMYSYLKEVGTAISFNDTVKSQLALDLAYNMIVNQQLYF